MENLSYIEKLSLEQTKLIQKQTELLIDGLKRVNKSILALHRAVSAGQVVDRLAQIANQAQLKGAINQDDKDSWT